MTLYEKFKHLRDAFRATFERGEWFDDEGALTTDATRVLFELKEFCYGDQTTFDADPRVHALKEGRRETLLRILGYLHLSNEQLLRLRNPDEKEDDHE